MIATICVISCALAPAQPASGPDWLLIPRLSRGQELVYKGTYTEEAIGQAVQFTRSYQLHSRVFVVDSSSQGLEVAFFTTLRQRKPTAAPAEGQQPDPGSVRLEVARCSPQGRLISGNAQTLQVPLTGPATAECGAFVEVPKVRVTAGHRWEAAEDGRPPRTWTVAGTESVSGTTCVKLVGTQQSDDWDRPRADRGSWRRQDVVWLSPRLGVAYRLERTVEQREPARKEPTTRTVTRLDLDNPLVYPGQLYEDRHREIVQYQGFAAAAQPLWLEPGKFPPKAYDALLAKIAYHLDNHPPTPYREAILYVRRRVEEARHGKAPPAAVADAGPRRAVAAVGQPAPDFVVNGLTGTKPVRLRGMLGRPLLLVFYNPASRSAEDLLRFAQNMQDRHGATVLGLAVTDDADAAVRQHRALKLQFALAAGKGLRQTYGVEATPKLVVVDGDGVVRGDYLGWGREIPTAVTADLKRWQRPAAVAETGGGEERR